MRKKFVEKLRDAGDLAFLAFVVGGVCLSAFIETSKEHLREEWPHR